MDSEFWKELRIVIQSEVERKLRGYRQISFDLEEEIVAEVLLNAHQKFATDGIRNPSRLRLHAENHVINAIRKIKRLYYRDWNVLDFLVDELSTTEMPLSTEVVIYEGKPGIDAAELEVAKLLSFGYSRANLLDKKVCSSRRELRKIIRKLKDLFH